MLPEKVFVAPRTGRCVTQGHERRDAKARGNCPSCYNANDAMVNAGYTTWGELEALGLSLPLLPDVSAKARLEEARQKQTA